MNETEAAAGAPASWEPTASLIPWDKNPRQNDGAPVDAVAASIQRFGFSAPIVCRTQDRRIIAGHTRWKAAQKLGLKTVPVRFMQLTEAQAAALALADNKLTEITPWDDDKLTEIVRDLQASDESLLGLGWDEAEMNALLTGLAVPAPPVRLGALVADFGAPPMTILDSRQGYWQDRKRWWIRDVGVESALGRENLADTSASASLQQMAGGSRGNAAGGSSFDPVLAELMFRWFCPQGGSVLDPFGGESVKGVVAGACGFRYTAVELRPEQVAANDSQWQQVSTQHELGQECAPRWVCGDSTLIDSLLPPGQLYDFSFTSPPYYDLEVYSDEAGDGSAMPSYPEFMQWYRTIFAQVVKRLRDGAFLVVKVCDVRDKDTGAYHCFTADNIKMFTELGMHFYNDAILVTPAGTAPIRASRLFPLGRKLARTHQNVLVFWKGNPRKVREALGDLDKRWVTEIENEEPAGADAEATAAAPAAAAAAAPAPAAAAPAATPASAPDTGLQHALVRGIEHPLVTEALALVNGTSGSQPRREWGAQAPGIAALLRRRYEHIGAALEVQDAPVVPPRWDVQDNGTLWVAFSAGKDSLACALLARERGLRPVLWHVHGLNRSYPREEEWARRAAAAAGFPIVVDQVRVTGSSSYLEAPFKNQLIASMLVARMIAAKDGARYITGNHIGSRLVDPTPTENTHWSDSAETLAGYDAHLRASVSGLVPFQTEIRSDTHALAVVSLHGLVGHIHGCLAPARYHGQWRASVEKKGGGAPLLPGRCGTCVKCTREEIILQELGVRPRNAALIAHCVKRLRVLSEEIRTGHGKIDPLTYVLEPKELAPWAGAAWPAQLPVEAA